MERNDPADPIDRIDPAEPIERIDPADPTDKMDPDEPMDRADPSGGRARMRSPARARHGACLVRIPAIFAAPARDRTGAVGIIHVTSEGTVDAPPETAYDYIADYRRHHPNFLPAAFSDFQVESGGVGAGTVTRFKVTAGGRTREYQMRVTEPEPGMISESDSNSSLVTTWTVGPDSGNADRSLVRISTTWDGAGGIGGIFERIFAPRAMRGIYADELSRLNDYAHEQAPS
jgi:hypothetical protein